MKKLVTAIISAAVLIFCVFGFSACNGNDAENAVKLVPVESNSVGLMPDIDYYVLPEPAASTKVKKNLISSAICKLCTADKTDIRRRLSLLKTLCLGRRYCKML